MRSLHFRGDVNAMFYNKAQTLTHTFNIYSEGWRYHPNLRCEPRSNPPSSEQQLRQPSAQDITNFLS